VAPPPAPGLLLLLGALSAFGPLCIDMYLPGLPELRDDLGSSASLVGLTLSGCLAGLALGQLVAGPLSDARGRRAVILAGLGAFVLASVLCALAPSVWTLIALRVAQGFAGAAGIVAARATVRDRYEGAQAAHVFSLLLLVNGLAPILAPILGGQLLLVTSWRGIFLVLAAIGAVLLLACALRLPESLPPERRRTGGLRDVRRAFSMLVRDRAFAAMFAYISGSPFVLQEVYGVSAQEFSLLFALNAVGLVAAGRANSLLLRRHGPGRLLRAGLLLQGAGGCALLVVVATDVVGLAGVVPCLFVVVACIGLVLPNATALAMADFPQDAGSAAGLLGVLQYAIGAAAAPLVGLAGDDTALPMGLVIAVLTVLASVALASAPGRHPA
jgi:MFS transporter, DHA1 family, multidrug resistance protein